MIKVSTVVEGGGEVVALPVLLRRIQEWVDPSIYVNILPPIKVKRDRFIGKEDEFRRYVALAGAKCEINGWVIILMDADDDCPVKLGKELLVRAKTVLGHDRVSVVLANREYEAWFIAAAKSLSGYRGFSLAKGEEVADPDRPRNAKGWMGERMGGYSETLDQPAFSAIMDLQLAFDRSRSFRKLCTEWRLQLSRVKT